MRFLLFCCLSLFITGSALAQNAGRKPLHYLFPEFIKGTVKMKSGVRHEVLLNYSTVLEEMVIAQGDVNVRLGELENVDTVYIQNRKFIPAGKVFYEVSTDMPVPFFIAHTCKAIPNGQQVAFGGTSQLSNTNSPADRQIAGFYRLDPPDRYTLTPEKKVIIKKDGQYIPITHAKKLAEVFPGKEDIIKKLAKENKTSFDEPEEVKQLVLRLL